MRDLSQRDSSIDIARGISIFLVVWGHANLPLSSLIYTFHIPVFFIISGFVYKRGQQLSAFF